MAEVKQWITVNGQHVPIMEGESKKDAVNKAIHNQQRVKDEEDKKQRQINANRVQADKQNQKEVTSEDIKAKLISKDSYTNKPEYKELHDRVKNDFAKRQELQTKSKELREELEKESTLKPKSEWTDEDKISALLGEKPTTYTERGKQLEAEYNRTFKEYQKADHEWTASSEKLRAWDSKQASQQKEIYNRDTKDISSDIKKEYVGFKTSESRTPYVDNMLKQGKARVVEMSPKTYLQEVSHNIFNKATLETTLRGTSVKDINKYMNMMGEGTKFDTPYLNYKDSQQEGRHRAIAAEMLGIKKIPVIIVR